MGHTYHSLFSFFPLALSLCNDLYVAFGRMQFSCTLFLYSWTNALSDTPGYTTELWFSVINEIADKGQVKLGGRAQTSPAQRSFTTTGDQSWCLSSNS